MPDLKPRVLTKPPLALLPYKGLREGAMASYAIKSEDADDGIPLIQDLPYQGLALGAAAMEHGALKYWPGNWRDCPVDEVATYRHALLRHLCDPESEDPESGVHHLGHIIAGAAIMCHVLDIESDSVKCIDEALVLYSRESLMYRLEEAAWSFCADNRAVDPRTNVSTLGHIICVAAYLARDLGLGYETPEYAKQYPDRRARITSDAALFGPMPEDKSSSATASKASAVDVIVGGDATPDAVSATCTTDGRILV